MAIFDSYAFRSSLSGHLAAFLDFPSFCRFLRAGEGEGEGGEAGWGVVEGEGAAVGAHDFAGEAEAELFDFFWQNRRFISRYSKTYGGFGATFFQFKSLFLSGL